MALVDCGLISLYQGITAETANTVSTLDAADETSFLITQVKAGTITHVHFRCVAATTGFVGDLRLETVGGDGKPTGTLWGTTTNGAVTLITTTSANTWFDVTLTLGATVAHGDVLAIGLVSPTVSFGNITIANMLGTLLPSNTYPYKVAPLRSSTPITGVPAAYLLEYSDGTFLSAGMGVVPALRLAGLTLNTGTNPDEAGLLFTPTMNCTCAGFGFNGTCAAAANFRGNLYQVGNDTPLAVTGTLDGDQSGGTASGGRHHRFTTLTDLTAGTGYRIGLVPLSANSIVLQQVGVPTTGSRKIFGPHDIMLTQRNRSGTTDPDAAAWTDTNTSVAALWPLISRLDNGASAGGLKGDGTGAFRHMLRVA